ncbi:MAG TPA: hypothetical protein DCG47_07275 [Spirochaetaceae bacterium]|jgi:hypothetical protein|nr:hypothetical protein [Spirochaetaceae bacterium]
MNIRDLSARLGFEAVQDAFEDRPLAGGYTSDLLSDVMAKAEKDQVLITIQAHKNTVAVASLIGLAAIVLCNQRPVPQDMVDSAREEGIALFRTDMTQFKVSGLLYQALGQ